MELTLKNVKINQAMSEETTCFSATVYVDNHKIGTVVNRGHGGSNEYQWTDPVKGHVLEDWAEKEVILTEDPCDPEKTMFVTFDKLDWKIGEVLDRFENDRWLKRMCKTRTLFKLNSDESDGDDWKWWVIKAPFCELAKKKLQQMYGDDLGEIANETRV
jgi:hypothetical protein